MSNVCKSCGKEIQKRINFQSLSRPPNRDLDNANKSFNRGADSVFELLKDLEVDRSIARAASKHFREIIKALDNVQQEVGGFFAIIEQSLNDKGYGG